MKYVFFISVLTLIVAVSLIGVTTAYPSAKAPAMKYPAPAACVIMDGRIMCPNFYWWG
uniref:Uncharacterized protein n=1 Tax=Anopheles funestus TaxID=62324 RepID=A0A182S0Z1_ANOFN